jgi:hypothetical protein
MGKWIAFYGVTASMKDSWDSVSHSENEDMPLDNGYAKLCQVIIKRAKMRPVGAMQRAS